MFVSYRRLQEKLMNRSENDVVLRMFLTTLPKFDRRNLGIKSIRARFTMTTAFFIHRWNCDEPLY